VVDRRGRPVSERTSFPHAVEVIDPAWIPLADGTRLCARIWLPEGAGADAPVPAVLEYLPYRKDDVTAADDALHHPYFAGCGYASLRVDIRGSGDSSGILTDEYSLQEQDDALEVLAWIAAQPWCTGKVGMMGISWGGFNSLQIAARRPPELAAIITACSTDDRYDNDVHYLGGVPLGYYLLPWASVMLAFNARPPDPTIVGDAWRALWLQRLDGNVDLIETWLSHQRRDDYWRHGSIAEDYGAITCPVFAVGGFADAYVDAIFRMLEHLECPRRALVGPWGHMWPQLGRPGPQVGFLQEAVRWWDQHLKGHDTGIMDEPMLRAWMQDAVPPRVDYEQRPGRWVAEASWPRAAADQAPPIAYHLTAQGLRDDAPGPVEDLHHCSPQTVGLDAGAWCAYGNPVDLPDDQRRDDARSLTFDTPPLEAPFELLGQPIVRLRIAADRPRAFVVARLCDVAPDGASTIITRGVLNLCHRDGHAEPVAIEPGVPFDVRLALKSVAYAVPAGHRVRLALSTSYWPWLWPSPEPATITVATGGASTLALPLRSRHALDDALPDLGPPETAPRLAVTLLDDATPQHLVAFDGVTGETSFRMSRRFVGARRFPSGIEYHDDDPITFRLVGDDPLSARVECFRRIEIRRADWRTRVEVRAVMTADADDYHVETVCEAYEGDTLVHTRTAAASIPRDHS
jgi:putative CocE/NonD family hydrolase